MSESGNSYLGHVLPRWMTITEHLKMRQIDYRDVLVPFMFTENTKSFVQCYKWQIVPLYIVAYYLLPESLTKAIPEHFDNQLSLQSFFRQYTSSESDYEKLCYQFESFRA